MSKLVVKNGAKVTLNLSSNVIGDSNVEIFLLNYY